MTQWEHPSESFDEFENRVEKPALTRLERQRLQQQLLSETVLKGIDAATMLRSQSKPSHTSTDYTIGDTLDPSSLRLPKALDGINATLQELAISFDTDGESERSGLTVRASFEDNWHAVFQRPSHTAIDEPFRGEAVHLDDVRAKDVFNSDDNAELARYTISVSQREVASLIESLLYLPHNPNKLQLLDAQDKVQSTLIQEILRESRGADVLEDTEHCFTFDDEMYEISCLWHNDRVVSVEVSQVLQNEMTIVDGTPKNVWRKLVARMEFDNFKQAIEFYLESSDKGDEPLKLDTQMVERVKDILDKVEKTFIRPDEEMTDTSILDNPSGDLTGDPLLDENGFNSPDAGA